MAFCIDFQQKQAIFGKLRKLLTLTHMLIKDGLCFQNTVNQSGGIFVIGTVGFLKILTGLLNFFVEICIIQAKFVELSAAKRVRRSWPYLTNSFISGVSEV